MTAAAGRRISVIESDIPSCSALYEMLHPTGCLVRNYLSADHFLSDRLADSDCLIANIFMPDMDGLELLQETVHRGIAMPVVLVSDQVNVTLAVSAMKAGAADFLLRPFDAPTLIASVENALWISRKACSRVEQTRAARHRIALLTPRERHVLDHLAKGHSNKMTAYELGISARTVEFHRARIMEKLSASSVSDLVRLALIIEEFAVRPHESQDAMATWLTPAAKLRTKG